MTPTRKWIDALEALWIASNDLANGTRNHDPALEPKARAREEAELARALTKAKAKLELATDAMFQPRGAA